MIKQCRLYESTRWGRAVYECLYDFGGGGGGGGGGG